MLEINVPASELFAKREQQILSGFFQFLRFQSVSSEPSYKPQMIRCVEWLKEFINSMGFSTEIWDTGGHPALFAELKSNSGSKNPTLLIYNHYDVQPVDPLELWHSEPFSPEIREGKIFARGAVDNKGQCFYVLSAIKDYLALHKEPTLNIKLLIEGEEEIGSPGLSKILKDKAEKLQADHLLVVDTGIPAENLPAVTIGTRGIVTMTVEFKEAKTDLHSGSYGGLAYNPNRALVGVLARLFSSDGRVAVPGFYDNVVTPSVKDYEGLDLSFDEAQYQETVGKRVLGGDPKKTPRENSWLLPTLEINGIGGGYSGEGFKTVIPAKSVAKLSCRIVPNQDPYEIARKVDNYIKELTPEGLDVTFTMHAGVGKALRTSSQATIVKKCQSAYSQVFGCPCSLRLEGASIPIVPELASVSGAHVALMGLQLNSDQTHAPNEHFSIKRFKQGYLVIYTLLTELA